MREFSSFDAYTKVTFVSLLGAATMAIEKSAIWFTGHYLRNCLVPTTGFTMGDPLETVKDIPVGKCILQFAWAEQKVWVAGAAEAWLISREGFIDY